MRLSEYQERARQTDQAPLSDSGNDLLDHQAVAIPLFGLAGEVGTLLAEYKKRLRDGESHTGFLDRVADDLGDILWYIANTATKFGLDLDEVGRRNLHKVADRWPAEDASSDRVRLDADAPKDQQLPDRFSVHFRETDDVRQGISPRVIATLDDGEPFGNPLRDNVLDQDNYRYHDVFHIANAAILGWSPCTRRNMGRKRKYDPRIDEAEDAGRAIVIEEAVVALIFDYARKHDWLRNVTEIDFGLLKAIRNLTSPFEVSTRPLGDWENAILEGVHSWLTLSEAGGGSVTADLTARTLKAVGLEGETSA